jgi:flagellar FliL protein
MAKGEKSGEKKGSGAVGGILVVTLLCAGGGAGFGFFLSGSLEHPKEAKAHAAHEVPAKLNVPSTVRLVELQPIIANLSEPKTAWMRVEAALVIEGEVEGVDALAGKIAEDVVAYLKTTTLAQFEGASGFQNLREDLNDRARVRGGSQVRELVIHGVVVE